MGFMLLKTKGNACAIFKMATMSQTPLNDLFQDSNNAGNIKKNRDKKRKRKRHRNKKTVIQGENITEQLKNDPFEIIYDKVELERWDPNYAYFSKIFDKFRIPDGTSDDNVDNKITESKTKIRPLLLNVNDDDDDEEETKKLSKRKLKQKLRISIAHLKQCVGRPEVVEMHDANSKEAILLIHLKSYRNTVPVPKHWSYKRKYLQGKRGFVKPPFELPDYIKATGIMELRSAYQQKEDSKNLKSKMRNKIRPKLGRVDIDYQKLHDAFFKYQTNCRVTMHGDLYYEGKEFEVKLKQKKPGDISDDLRIALGMPVGMNKHLVPPPWLIAMQRYGPPPSYPNLKIAGLNAPIPEGATFGYHAGGWGKPPVDELGRPLYGDVFGTNTDNDAGYYEEVDIDKSLWGELEEAESEEEYEEEMEDLTANNEEYETAGLTTPFTDGLITPSITLPTLTTSTGVDNTEMLELRKRKFPTEKSSDSPVSESHLYSIIPSKKADVNVGVIGTTHTYDIASKQDIKLNENEIMTEIDMDIEESSETQEKSKKREKYPNASTSSSSSSKNNKDKKKEADSKSSKKTKEFKF